MTFFFNRNKQPSLKRENFLLTEGGRAALQVDFTSGSPTVRILTALETHGMSASLEDIARSAHMTIGQVERILPRLLKAGMVQISGGGEFDDD